MNDVTVEHLTHALHTDIFKVWPSTIKGFRDLKTNKKSIVHGIEHDGRTTVSAFSRIIRKALSGANTTMVIFGGSSTKGADLGYHNRLSTFHYIFYRWWQRVVAPLTKSHMKREVIGIGGVGSTYFGHCWQEYLDKNESVDLVLWEFNLNDPDSDEYGKGVEKFIRSVLLYPSKPALIFTKFFLRSEFPSKIRNKLYCPMDGEKFEVLTNLSKHYSFSILDLLATTCHLVNTTNTTLSVKDMFVTLHPSHIAHAQLGYILIFYVRQMILRILGEILKPMKAREMSRRNNAKIISVESLVSPFVQRSLYNASDALSCCWTAVVPDYRFRMPHHLFRLNMSHYWGLEVIRLPIWNLQYGDRSDVRGGYRFHPGRNNSVTFEIEPPSPKAVYVAVTHAVLGGMTEFSVNNDFKEFSKLTINCSRQVHPAMHVNYLGVFSPGSTRLSIATITGWCQLSAVIIE